MSVLPGFPGTFFIFSLVLPLSFLWWVNIIHSQQFAIAHFVCFFYNLFYSHCNFWEILLQPTHKKGFTMWLPPLTFTAANNTASIYLPPATTCSSLVVTEVLLVNPQPPWVLLAPAACEKMVFRFNSILWSFEQMNQIPPPAYFYLLKFMILLFSSFS